MEGETFQMRCPQLKLESPVEKVLAMHLWDCLPVPWLEEPMYPSLKTQAVQFVSDGAPFKLSDTADNCQYAVCELGTTRMVGAEVPISTGFCAVACKLTARAFQLQGLGHHISTLGLKREVRPKENDDLPNNSPFYTNRKPCCT